jgi:hypothetical protein
MGRLIRLPVERALFGHNLLGQRPDSQSGFVVHVGHRPAKRLGAYTHYPERILPSQSGR